MPVTVQVRAVVTLAVILSLVFGAHGVNVQVIPSSLNSLVNATQQYFFGLMSYDAHFFLWSQKEMAIQLQMPLSNGGCTSRTCDLRSSFSLTTMDGQVIQECGGTSPLLNIKPSKVACDDNLFCGPVIELSAGAAGDRFTGWLVLHIEKPAGCVDDALYGGATVTMYFDCSGAPLCNVSNYQNLLVLTPPAGQFSAADIGRLLDINVNEPIAVPELRSVFLSPGEARDVFFVQSDAVGNASSEALWHQACFAETMRRDCIITPPTSANHVTIRVAQIQGTIFPVTLYGWSPDMDITSISCGGSIQASSSFRDDLPQDGLCNVFLSCYEGFIVPQGYTYTVDLSTETAPSNSCSSIATVMFDFSFRPVENFGTNASCDFTCDGNTTCLSYDQVCDGILDCDGGLDERSVCWGWSPATQCPIDVLTSGLTFSTLPSLSIAHCWKLQVMQNFFSPSSGALVAYNGSHCFFSAGSDDNEILTITNQTIVAVFGTSSCAAGASYSINSPQVFVLRANQQLSLDILLKGFTQDIIEPLLPPSVSTGANNIALVCSSISGPVSHVVERQMQLSFANSSLQGSFASYPLYETPCSAIDLSLPCTVNRTTIRRLKVVVEAFPFRLRFAPAGAAGFILTWWSRRSPVETFRRNTAQCYSTSVSSSTWATFEHPSLTGGVRYQVCTAEFGNEHPVEVSSVSVAIKAVSQDVNYAYSVSYALSQSPPNISQVSKIENSFVSHATITFASWILVVLGAAALAAALVTLKIALPAEAWHLTSSVADCLGKSGRLLQWVREDHARYKQIDRRAVLVSFLSMLIAVVGGFLLVWFTTDVSYDANAAVLLEFYRDHDCGRSLFSPRPYCVAHIDPSTARSCLKRPSVGCAQPIYALVQLDQNVSSGVVSVTSQVETSSNLCTSAALSTVASDTCVPTNHVFRSAPADATFVVFRVGSKASMADRFTYFKNVGSQEAFKSRVKKVPPQLVPNSMPLGNRSFFSWPRLRLRYARTLRSSQPFRFESLAEPSDIVLAPNAHRLLIQVEDEAFGSSSVLDRTKAFEQQSTQLQTSLPANFTRLGPADGDVPLGFVYNYFGTGNVQPGKDAGPDAARYFAVRSSTVDAGFALRTSSDSSFAISLYVKLDTTSLGFAFAVTDAYENLNTLHSPILDKMIDVLDNGCSSTLWAGFDHQLYYGLFVDGANKRLQYVTASTSLVECVAWDATALGFARLFNGAWHHVAIILRIENYKVKVQLVVDGQTSLSQPGWNQCLSDFPAAIADVDERTVERMFDETAYQGGSLITGYFNGGIGHLEFHNGAVDLFDMWRTSTRAIQLHNAISRGSYLALGWTLVAIGLIGCVMTAVTAFLDLRREKIQKLEDLDLAGRALHQKLWRQYRQTTSLTTARRYRQMSYELVKTSLHVDGETMCVLLDELQHQASNPIPSLVRIVFSTSRGAVSSQQEKFWEVSGPISLHTDPSADEWTELLTELHADPCTAEDVPGEEESVAAREGGAQAIRSDTSLKAQKASDPNIDACTVSVLFVIQSLYMWIPAMSLPKLYLVAFAGPFSIFSLDWFRISGLSTLGAPVVLLALCLALFGFVFVSLSLVECSFVSHLALYAARRFSTSSLVEETSRTEPYDDSCSSPYVKHCFSPAKKSRTGDSDSQGSEENANSHPQARPLDCSCAIHRRRTLAPQMQSSVWPFDCRPSCCVTIDGKRCGISVGRMYCCNLDEKRTAGDVGSRCQYAVCERHFQGKGLDLVLAEGLASARKLSQRGATWAAAVAALFVSQALFTPSLRTALMILACHPFFQCEFSECWSNITQPYAVAAFLCSVLVVIFGAFYPLWLSFLLHRRKRYLTEFVPSAQDSAATEWCLFSDSDASAIASLYRHLRFEWMYLSPVLLAWKIVLVCPVVLLETQSFAQLVGVSVAEMTFGLFIFSTNPFISPIVNIIYKIGSVHQIMFLGILSLDTVSRFDSPRGSLAKWLVSLTACYLALCVLLIAWTKMSNHLGQRRVHSNEVLQRLGLAPQEENVIFAIPDAKVCPPTARAVGEDS